MSSLLIEQLKPVEDISKHKLERKSQNLLAPGFEKKKYLFMKYTKIFLIYKRPAVSY